MDSYLLPMLSSSLRFKGWLMATLLLGFAAGFSQAQNTAGERAAIEAETYEIDQATGWAVGSGNVKVVYEQFKLEADQVRYNFHTGDIAAEGNIRLTSPQGGLDRAGLLWQTSLLVGNIHEGVFRSTDYEMVSGDFFMRGASARRESDGRLIMESSEMSTCEHLVDRHKAVHYHITCQRISYHPKSERILLRHAVFKVGSTPVFYWPYFSWNRDRRPDDLSIQAGHSRDWGAFLIVRRHWQLTDEISTRLGVEGRTRRGFAVSSTTRRTTDASDSELSIYAMHDANPPETESGYNRRFKSVQNRYRLQFRHLRDLAERWQLRLQLDKLSDIDMLEEWFESEFRRRPQPQSFADLRYQGDNYTFSVFARPRINEFQTVVERLPELRLEMPRQPLGDTNFLYQSDNSLASLHMRWRNFSRPRAPELTDGPKDYSAWRLDSLHMLYRPFDLGRQVQLTPRLGLRMTHYSNSSRRPMTTGDLIDLYQVDSPDAEIVDIPISNYDSSGGAVTRFAGEAGLEISKKYETVWPDRQFPRMGGGEGLRLIKRPYANYTYIPEPTENRDRLYHFDRVDRIIKQNFIRLGIENRLQTLLPDQPGIHTLATMNTYADFHLESPPGRGNLGNLANNLQITPPGNWSFNSLLIVDLDRPGLNYTRTGFSVRRLFDSPVDLSLGYSYSDSYRSTELNSMGSTLLDYRGESISTLEFGRTNEATIRAAFPVNRKTAAAVGYSHDFNEGQPSSQWVEITRDLHCWIGVLRYRRYGTGNQNTEVSLMLYLSAFADGGLGVGR